MSKNHPQTTAKRPASWRTWARMWSYCVGRNMKATDPEWMCPIGQNRVLTSRAVCLRLQWASEGPSVVSDSLRLMDCSTPGFPVHHQLLELTQTHVHWVGDSIQPSHPPLSSPSPSAFYLSQSLFQWVSSLHQVARVLEFQLQHQSFQ